MVAAIIQQAVYTGTQVILYIVVAEASSLPEKKKRTRFGLTEPEIFTFIYGEGKHFLGFLKAVGVLMG